MFKTKYFYSHLVDLSELHSHLQDLSLSSEERDEIHDLLDDIFHHHIVDALLDILPTDKHHSFSQLLSVSDPEILTFLHTHCHKDPEITIITTFHIVKQEALLDIHLSKPSHKKKR